MEVKCLFCNKKTEEPLFLWLRDNGYAHVSCIMKNNLKEIGKGQVIKEDNIELIYTFLMSLIKKCQS
jgi:hypothetical protein